MKISKTQIAIILSLCILVIIIILSLGKPRPKPAVTTGPEAKPEEQVQVLPQAGKYELPPQENSGYPASQEINTPTVPSIPSLPKGQATPGTLTENTQNPNNSSNSGILNPPGNYEPSPDLPQKPPKLPPPEKMQEMQRKGIVAF